MTEKTTALVRTIARMERYNFDANEYATEDGFETVNNLIDRARQIVQEIESEKLVAFPDASVPVTLTGYQWTALLARIACPDKFSTFGTRTYNEATERLKAQLLAASARHASAQPAKLSVVN